MPIIQPTKERHTVQDEGASLKFSIPSQKNLFGVFFLGVFLIVWTFGEIVVVGILLTGIIRLIFETQEASPGISTGGLDGSFVGGLFVIIWWIFWTAGGGFGLYNFFWHLVGKEKVEVNREMISIQNAIFRFGRTRQYLTTYIKDLRVSPVAVDNNMFGWPRASRIWGVPTGHVAFDYGSKSIRFGSGIDEAEAKQILEKVIARFPQFRG